MASHPTLRIRIPLYKQEQLSPNLPSGLLCPRPSIYCQPPLPLPPLDMSPLELDAQDSSSEESSLDDPPASYKSRLQDFVSGSSLCPSGCTTV